MTVGGVGAGTGQTLYNLNGTIRDRVWRMALAVGGFLRGRGRMVRVAAFTLAGLITGTAAFAQDEPAPRKWRVDIVAGLSRFELPTDGTAALPSPGPNLTTSSPVNPSRKVPTWFLGDGASLVNGVNQEFGVVARLTPLDAALSRIGIGGANAPQFGVRLGRDLGERWALEFGVEFLAGAADIDPALREAAEASVTSFTPAFQALLTTGPFSGAEVSSSLSQANATSRELAFTGALRFQVLSGATQPYLTLGGGLISRVGALPSLTLTGRYKFTVTPGLLTVIVPFEESDTLTIRFEQGTSVVGFAGAGVRHRINERLSLVVDGRAYLGRNTMNLRLDSAPKVTTGAPAGFIESFTTPAIQFSNATSTGRESSLSGTPLTGFKAFTTSGAQVRWSVTAGVAVRF